MLFRGRAPFTPIPEPPDSRKRVDSVLLRPPPPSTKLPPPPSRPRFGLTTPGDNCARIVKLRCGIGRSVTSRPVMRSPRTLVSLSTSGADSAVIVTEEVLETRIRLYLHGLKRNSLETARLNGHVI